MNMNRKICGFGLTLMCLLTAACPGHAGVSWRPDGACTLKDYMPVQRLPFFGDNESVYNGRLTVNNGSGVPGATIEITHTEGPGITLRSPIQCNAKNEYFNTGSSIYAVKCDYEVKYKGMGGFQPYNPSYKRIKIDQINLNLTWEKDGQVIDPSVDLSPCQLFNQILMTFQYDDNKTYSSSFYLNANSNTGVTELSFNIDTIKHISNPEFKLEYDWEFTIYSGSLNSQFYYKMSMVQLDGKMELAYLPENGTGAVKLVPNNVVTIEEGPKKKSGKGALTFKITSPRDFGARTTQLKVTVECQ